MRLSEKDGGLAGVARFLTCSDGDELECLGSSSVNDSDTGAGAIDGRCDGGFLEISGVDCA